MKRFGMMSLVIVFFLFSVSWPALSQDDAKARLAEWRKGIWLLSDGSYAVYTDNHYFVLFASGEGVSANVYFGASQIRFHTKGMVRKQVIRYRKLPGGEPSFYKKIVLQPDHTEAPLEFDATLFEPGKCNIKDGIIYDSITEITDNYILLTSCNGDREKIFSNGISVYLPAGGGEAYSFRVERF